MNDERMNDETMNDLSNLVDDNNNDRNVRRNIGEPFVTLEDDETLDINSLTIKSLDELKDENAKRRKTGIYLQLIRIVSGSSSSGAKQSQYNYYNKHTKEKSSTAFTRLFLFSDYSSKNGEVVYIVENKNQNDRLWLRNPAFRDSGDISIGTLILIVNPPPIKLLLGGEIPILETRGGCIVMKTPSFQPVIRIDYRIDSNTTRSFVMNNTHL